MDEKYARGLFAGGDAISFDMVNDPFAQSAQNIFQYLQGRVAGLQINIDGANGPSIYLAPIQLPLCSSMKCPWMPV